MVVAVNFRVTGAAEIQRALTQLGERASTRVLRSALNRGAQVVVKRARELAPQPGSSDDPHASGLLRKSITKRLRRQRRGSALQVARVGIERPVASRYAHLVEYGNSRQSAEPFLRPAADESGSEVMRVLQAAMRAGIEREANKLRKK